VYLDIADLGDGRREPLSRPPTRHGRPGLSLTLGGVAGGSPQKGSDETPTGSSAGEDFPLPGNL
jgi:hypothetical protein